MSWAPKIPRTALLRGYGDTDATEKVEEYTYSNVVGDLEALIDAVAGGDEAVFVVDMTGERWLRGSCVCTDRRKSRLWSTWALPSLRGTKIVSRCRRLDVSLVMTITSPPGFEGLQLWWLLHHHRGSRVYNCEYRHLGSNFSHSGINISALSGTKNRHVATRN